MKASQIKVLIVDDDASLLGAVATIFKIFGFTTKEALNGDIAWGYLQKDHYDIVLSDIRMPILDGFQLLKRIKQNNSLVPKVLLASGFADHSVEELYHEGADGFFSKPFEASEVRACLHQTLLDPKDRFQKPILAKGLFQLNKKFVSLEEARVSQQFNLGRIGFFVALQYELPRVGEKVEFNFNFKSSSSIQNLVGKGQVLWQRPQENEHGPAGVGVQFASLDEFSLAHFLEWIKLYKAIPSIPRT